MKAFLLIAEEEEQPLANFEEGRDLQRLTEAERVALHACDAIIRRGVKIFIEVGQALLKVREGRLYRESHGSFEAYLGSWGISRPYAYQVIKASEVVAELSMDSDIQVLPTTESQARQLAKIKEPEGRKEAWKKVLTLCSEGATAVTAELVAKVVAERKVDAPIAQVGAVTRDASVDVDKVEGLLQCMETGLLERDFRKLEVLIEQLRRLIVVRTSSSGKKTLQLQTFRSEKARDKQGTLERK